MAYGSALRITAHPCKNVRSLDTPEAVEYLLVSAIAVAGMQRMGGPWVEREGPREGGKGPGLTGVAILCESHAVLHTYPEASEEGGWIMFDLVSCRDFDPNGVVKLITEWAGIDPDNVTVSCTAVGHDFPEPE